MQNESDVLVLGGGAMGTAAAWQLARRGCSVQLLEQFAIGHDLGSSHGYSRIIRRAYYEHPDYVPLVERAYELWHELEATSGEKLLTTTGIVEMGGLGGPLLQGSLMSCAQHGIEHELLDAAEIRRRFPQFRVPEWMQGVWQKDAGILAVERCIQTLRSAALRQGALVREEDEALDVVPRADGVTVRTRKDEYHARKLVVCAGSWTARMLGELALPLVVTRQAMGFFTPLHWDDFTIGRFPLFLMELGGHNFYGFPMFGVDAMKVADHSRGSITTPETVDRAFRTDDEQTLRAFLAEHIPGAAGRLNFGKICLYTNTPDADFILDQHPRHANVVIAAGFSGHGFKFATAVGEVLAELALDGRTRHRIDRFALARFGLKP